MHHQEQDARSLALHTAAVELMREDDLLSSENIAQAVTLGQNVSKDGALPLLKERQRKDAEDVAAGRRSARSLLMFQKDDLKGYRFTPNPASEFERSGDGW